MPDQSSSQLINIAARLLSGCLQKALDEQSLNLTVEQWRLLYYLWNEDGKSQQDLANIANKEKSTITRQIVDLERKGLIVRQPDTIDKRNKLIHLTEHGKSLEAPTLDIADRITKLSEKSIAESDIKTATKVLNIIVDNLRMI